MSSSPSAVGPSQDGLATTAPRRGTDAPAGTAADRRSKQDPVKKTGGRDEEERGQREPYSTSSSVPWAAVPLAEATPVAASLRLQKDQLEAQLELERQRVAELLQRGSLPNAPPASTTGAASTCSLLSKKKRWIALGIVVVAVVVLAVVIVATVVTTGAGGSKNKPPGVPNPAPATRSPPLPPTRDEDILAYTNSITLSNQTLSYPPSTTNRAEERAVQWLIRDDVNTNAADANALRQRYALTILWFRQTPTPFGTADDRHSDTWTSNRNECEWLDVECDGDGQVTALTLSEKNVRGRIPNDLGLLTKMTSLELGGNKMTGTIPSSLTAMTDLVSLGLATNLLTGTIPSSLGILTALTSLQLFDNKLNGTIPSSLAAMTDLVEALKALVSLSVDGNMLTGTIPSSLGTLTALTSLELYDNEFIGTIPSSLGTLTALTSLELYTNELNGTIPSSLGALTALTALDLSENQLSGTIPSSFGALVALTRLELYNNQLNGTLPLCGLNLPFDILVTDCLEVSCPCCTHCCPTASENGSIPVYEYC
jgi:Leucine-rich repeat (LRR) protein